MDTNRAVATLVVQVKENFNKIAPALQKSMSGMKSVASKIGKTVADAFGFKAVTYEIKKVSKELDNIVPKDALKQVKDFDLYLQEFARKTSYVTNIAADGIKSITYRMKGVPATADRVTEAIARAKNEFKQWGEVSVKALAEYGKTQKGTLRADTDLIIRIKQQQNQVVALANSLKALKSKWAAIKKIAGPILKAITNGLKAIVKAIKNAITFTVKLAVTLGRTLLNAAKSVLTVLGKISKTILSIPTAPFRALIPSLKNVSTIIAGMIGYTGLKALGRQLGEVAEEAGAIQSVRVIFRNFVQQATHNIEDFNISADDMIKKMRDITDGAFDTTTMLKYANLAFSLIGDSVGKDIPKMLGIAQAASLATGEDLDRMFSSLVKGIGRLSTRWLDNLGITLSTTEEYQRYGDEIGKVYTELTHAERVQALLNGAMREGEKIMLRTGNVSAFLATKMHSLSTAIKDTRDSVIHNFAPIATVILETIVDMAEKGQRRIDQWTRGFTDGFAKMAETIARVDIPSDFLVGQIIEPIREGREQMGYEAGRWAADTLAQGANIGSNLAIGILDGFADLFVAVVTAISNLLTKWFAPGSPPLVAPDIDIWGYKTMEEWVNGMLNYPITDIFPDIKEAMREVFDGDVKDSLFQWGMDALEPWTEGLSMLDLEFLTKAVEKALGRAQRLNKELTKSYKKQNTELFKMQVLGKSPEVIRAQLTKVKNAKYALNTNEKEIDLLEERREILREQLDLMRLMKRAIDKAASARKKAGAGAGGSLDDIGIPDIITPLAGTGNLEKLLSGVRKTFREALELPIKRVKEAWAVNTKRMGEAWKGLVKVIEDNDILNKIKNNAKAALTEIMSFIAGFAKSMFGVDISLTDVFGPLASADTSSMPLDVIERINRDWKASLGIVDLSKGMSFAENLKNFFAEIESTILEWSGKIETAWGKIRTIIFGASSTMDQERMGMLPQSDVDAMGGGLIDSFMRQKPKLDNMLDSFRDLGDSIATLINTISGDEGSAGWITAIGNAGGMAAGLLEGFAQATQRVVEWMTRFALMIKAFKEGRTLEGLLRGISVALEGASLAVTVPVEVAIGPLGLSDWTLDDLPKPEPKGWKDVGVNLVEGFNSGITEASPTSSTIVKEFAEAQEEVMRVTLRTHSASQVFAEIGVDVVAGFIEGIESEETSTKLNIYNFMKNSVIKTARTVFGTVTPGSPSTVFNQLANDLIRGFLQGFDEDREYTYLYIKEFLDNLIEVLVPVGGNAFSIGAAFSGGIAAGIRNGIPEIKKWARKAIEAAHNAATDEGEVDSPSKLFMRLGENLVDGLNLGLQSPVSTIGMPAYAGVGMRGSGGGDVTININAPIVESMNVPNTRVGRQVARQISSEISTMALLKRKPA